MDPEAKYVGFLQGMERKLEEQQWCYYLYFMLNMYKPHFFVLQVTEPNI